MSDMMNGNGTAGWKNWLIGILTAMLLGAVGSTTAAVKTHGEKIAVLESQIERLGRIEEKLDQVLQRRSH